MKVTLSTTRKSVIAVAIIAVVLGAGTVGALAVKTHRNEAVKTQATQTSAESTEKTSNVPEEATPSEAVAVQPVAEVPAPVQAPPVPPAEKPVLSTQEYGVMYLDLTSPFNQQCFDNIQYLYPKRFTPDQRERNVKALRYFKNVCDTGTLDSKSHGTYSRVLGYNNAEWFDGQLAANAAAN